MLTRTTNDKMMRIKDFLVRKKIPFTLKQTSQRMEIYSRIGNYANRESEFPANELNFIRRFKDQIIKQKRYKTIPNKFKPADKKNKYLADLTRKKIRYFHVNPVFKVGEKIDKCIEIDLKNAYWETAYKMGLMSEEIYQEGKTVSKKSRLAAIGCLAKVEKVFEFDGKHETLVDKKRSELTEFLWATICYRIGKLMYRSAKACGNDFLFVWVDAMFVRKEALPVLKKIFKEEGYDYSVEKADFIQFNATEIVVKGKGKWVQEDGKRIWKDTREFSFSVGKNMSTEAVSGLGEKK